MDLTQLYFAHAIRRRQRKARERREERQQEELEERRLEEAPANDTVGFWMIPQDDGFLKLRIASEYHLKQQKKDVSNQIDGALLPVWSFLVNAELLQRHFSWINDDVLEGLVGDSPKRFAQTLVNRAMRAGWSYVISGSNGVVIGAPKASFDELPKYMGDLVSELTGQDVHMPTNIRIRNVSGDPRVHLFNAAGNHEKSGSWQDFAGKVQSLGKDSELLNLIKRLQNPDQFKDLDAEQMQMFEPDRLEDALSRANQRERDDIGDAILMLILYYRKAEPSTDVRRLQRLAQKALTETTFHDLVRSTDQNGGYKNGGMVLVDGHRWVTDPNVRGRSDNSYFVITRPPAISIDNDGDVLLRYMFRSRSDRNTTGMAQSGYIKFLPDKGFFKRVGRAIQRFLKGESMWNRDVHVSCSCPDWKYRWAWVASKGGFSHKLGRPGDPTDEAPQQTNPDRKVSLCKHLYQLRLVLNNPPKQFKTELERARKSAEAAGAQLDDKGDLVVEPQAQTPQATLPPGQPQPAGLPQPNKPEAVQEIPAGDREDDGEIKANDDGIRPNP